MSDLIQQVEATYLEMWKEISRCDYLFQRTLPFAIYKSNRLIGFVSIYFGEQNHQIINFLIDDAYQNRGYGTAAAKACIDFIQKEWRADVISVPVELDNVAALNFWKKIGFVSSDSIEDGYVFMRLRLTSSHGEKI